MAGNKIHKSVGYSYRANQLSTGSAYAILDTDGYDTIAVTTGAGNKIVDLPVAANNQGRNLRIIKADNGAGLVVVTANGADMINGSSAYNLATQYFFIDLECNGANWYIVGTNIVYQ